MKYALLLTCPVFLFGCALSKTQKELHNHSNHNAPVVKTITDDNLGYCYGLTGLAKTTVINRNKGVLLEKQQQKRKDALGEQSNSYAIIDDYTKKVYLKKITNSIESAINFHKSCIALQLPDIEYQPHALSTCPMASSAIDMVNFGRHLDKTQDQTLELIKTNYPGFSNAFKGGYQGLVEQSYAGEYNSGIAYYKQCMANNLIK